MILPFPTKQSSQANLVTGDGKKHLQKNVIMKVVIQFPVRFPQTTISGRSLKLKAFN